MGVGGLGLDGHAAHVPVAARLGHAHLVKGAVRVPSAVGTPCAYDRSLPAAAVCQRLAGVGTGEQGGNGRSGTDRGRLLAVPVDPTLHEDGGRLIGAGLGAGR